MLALHFFLAAQDQRGGAVAGSGAEQQHILALVAHAALGTPAEINGAAQNLAGVSGQHTGGVHLAQGVLGSVHRDIVVVQHGFGTAKVDGIEVILGLGVVQQRAGAAGRNAAAQFHAHLLHAGRGAFFYSHGVPAAGTAAQQLHLHQFDVGPLGGADAHKVCRHAVFGVAAQHLHKGNAGVCLHVHVQHAHSVRVGGIQRELKHGRFGHRHALSHRQRMAHGGIFQHKGIHFSTHAALGKGGKFFFALTDPGGQGDGKVCFAPVPGRFRQGGGRRGRIHAALVPGGHRQAVHVGIIHQKRPLLSQCCLSFPDGSGCSFPRRTPRAAPWQWARQSRPRSAPGRPPRKGRGS